MAERHVVVIDYSDEERPYAECQTCCAGCSGAPHRVERWADDHEAQDER